MLKQWRMPFAVLATVLIGILISACGGGSGSGNGGSATPTTLGTPGTFTCVQGSITASGSTALAPLVKAVAADYSAKCSGANITVNLGGSGTGLGQVENGTVQIGDSDIFRKANQGDLVDHQVAVVVFAIITNSDVGVKNLTTAQLQGIYSGKITNWSQVGGPDQNITVVSRPTSSGTRATFQNYVIGQPESITGPSHLETDSTSTVIQNVGSTPYSIGYAATGPLAGVTNVTQVSIDGYTAEQANVADNNYKFWGFEHMYTKGPATGLAEALIDYMTSSQGKQEAAKLGFLEPTDISSAATAAHQK
jgi:phosphate transport system substrate-binding protein